ncbi:MAG: Wzz/FepE/Etk N-terminal domain-containing protein [Candidatus Desulfatibia sp.]|uniref:GumC family protein n=1 Tax=Candidatus Desulfatibia sp. TaxID=3101189 RepID=UPI002F331846
MTHKNKNTADLEKPYINQKPQIHFDDHEDEINLLDLFQVVLKRKKMIAQIVGGAIILSVVYILLLPKIYTATARILPPQKASGGVSSLLSQAGGMLGGLAGGLIGGGSSSDLYVGILKSRSVADNLIEKFDLQELYDQKYREDIYKKLAKRTSISVSRKDQIISVAVEARQPRRAADMANAYVQMLDKINRTVNITAGHRKRVFLENRLKNVKKDLAKAETVLKEFQEEYKIVALEEQAKVAIESAAKIKGEIITTQTELEVLKQFGTERQNEAVMLKSKIAELYSQLRKIETGTPGNSPLKKSNPGKENSNLFIPFNKMPALGLELMRLMREAKIQEKVFELMTTQYELAKIEEAKDVNTIQVLDRAVAPDKKSKPKRRLIVMLATFMAFFTAVFTAFAMEFIERVRTEDPERSRQFKEHYRPIKEYCLQAKKYLMFWKSS